MLVTTEELLALLRGGVEPDRLVDVLDRLERCQDSTAALQVLVTLRAHREEALAAIHRADQPVVAPPVPHPAFVTKAPSWGLRLAASVAVAALAGFWAAGSPVATLASGSAASVVALATVDIDNFVPTSPRGGVLAARDETAVDRAAKLIDAGHAGPARDILRAALASDAAYDAKVHLFLGMAEYFDGDFSAANERLGELLESPAASDDTAIARQAAWYRANALLQLEQPVGAVLLLEGLKAEAMSPQMFQQRAAELYADVFAALGWELSKGVRDER